MNVFKAIELAVRNMKEPEWRSEYFFGELEVKKSPRR